MLSNEEQAINKKSEYSAIPINLEKGGCFLLKQNVKEFKILIDIKIYNIPIFNTE
jgi:hypothetical protein